LRAHTQAGAKTPQPTSRAPSQCSLEYRYGVAILVIDDLVDIGAPWSSLERGATPPPGTT
jgi:hypothetical protein